MDFFKAMGFKPCYKWITFNIEDGKADLTREYP